MALPLTAYTSPTGGAQNFTYVGGPFGGVPEAVRFPEPYADLSAVYPNLSGSTAALSALIASQLAGQLSPETQRAIQDASARFGVTSGMPGSGLQQNRTVRDLGIATEALQQRGAQNFLSALPTIRGTMTVDPALQYAINERNSVMASAPNPGAAANYSESLYNRYLSQTSGGGGGSISPPSMTRGLDLRPRTGSGSFASAPPSTGVFQGTGGSGRMGSPTLAPMSPIGSPIPPSPFGTGASYQPLVSSYGVGYDLPEQAPSYTNPWSRDVIESPMTTPSYRGGYGVGYNIPEAPTVSPAFGGGGSYLDGYGSVFGGGAGSPMMDADTASFLDSFIADYGTDWLS